MVVSTRYSHALACIAVVLAAAGAAAVPAAAQTWPHRPKPAQRVSAYARPAAASPQRIALATVTESEPNDSLSTADPVTMGDTVTGTINPARDVDYFSVTVTAGTRLNLDVDAAQIGSPLDAIMALFTSEGTMLAYSDDVDGADPRIRYTVPTTGQYIVGIADYAGAGGSNYFYTLKFGTLQPGPGDPTTLFARDLGYPRGMAADPSGNLFVVDQNANRIMRVSATGTVSTYLSLGNTIAAAGIPVDLAIDGVGDLLAAGTDSAWQGGTVLRITAAGAAPTHFARFQGSATALTVGPDGDVWVANSGCGCILRFDPAGARKDSILVGWSASDLAFSPSGELHFTTGYTAVMKLVGATVDTVIQAAPYLETIAFDRDGYLYVGNGYLGEVTLYDPTYHRVGDVIAGSNLGGPLTLAFGRGTDGAMTSRLFAANGTYNVAPPFAGGIVEMNNTGIRAVGLRIGLDLLRLSTTALRDGVIGAEYADTVRLTNPPAGQQRWSVASGGLPPGLSLDAARGVIAGIPTDSGRFAVSVRGDAGTRFGIGAFTLTIARPDVTVADAANHLLGAGTLTPALERFLDLTGNRNGRYDVGDFHAYLRSKNLLPTAGQATASTVGEGKP